MEMVQYRANVTIIQIWTAIEVNSVLY